MQNTEQKQLNSQAKVQEQKIRKGGFPFNPFTTESSSNAASRDKKKNSKQDFKKPPLSNAATQNPFSNFYTKFQAEYVCVLMMMGSLNFMASRMQDGNLNL